MRISQPAITVVLIAALLAVAVWSLSVGPVNLDLNTILRSLIGRSDATDVSNIILFEIRLPRTLLAILVGISLGMSGAALQALVKNPLAEPGILGISSSSALGAVAIFYSGAANVFPFALAIGGLIGAAIATAILFAIAARTFSTVTLILAGVAINAFAGAMTSLALNLSPNPFAAYEIYFWLMGSFANRSFDHVWLMLPFTAAGITLLLLACRRLDAFVFGDEVAYTLGVNVKTTRVLVIAGTALAVGAGVAVAGVVGFVGLVVPHLLRPVVGEQPSHLVPLSGLGGGILTLAADNICRIGISSGELKIGVVTALLGAPFLLLLILKIGHDR
ncbi:MAG: FecCD family ABC transporter permease [Gammaproteobacteria bacterium]